MTREARAPRPPPRSRSHLLDVPRDQCSQLRRGHGGTCARWRRSPALGGAATVCREIGQTLPGLNSTNVSILVGDQLRGIRGAVAAFLECRAAGGGPAPGARRAARRRARARRRRRRRRRAARRRHGAARAKAAGGCHRFPARADHGRGRQPVCLPLVVVLAVLSARRLALPPAREDP